ncbi:MAG: helix-turn-helix transcriptional regulator [Patescibacteria group bacterium]|nr:helix-turn-helix transcriptional regulator [Patescibacteria group bacterium]
MENTLGKIISQARKKREISQKSLAESINKDNGEKISPQYLNDIERDRRIPSNYVLEEIAKTLDIDPIYLFLFAEKLPDGLKAAINKKDENTVISAYKVFRKKLS